MNSGTWIDVTDVFAAAKHLMGVGGMVCHDNLNAEQRAGAVELNHPLLDWGANPAAMMTVKKAQLLGLMDTNIPLEEWSGVMDEMMRLCLICVDGQADKYLTLYTCTYLHDKAAMSQIPFFRAYVDGLLEIITRFKNLNTSVHKADCKVLDEYTCSMSVPIPHPVYTQQCTSHNVRSVIYQTGLSLKRAELGDVDAESGDPFSTFTSEKHIPFVLSPLSANCQSHFQLQAVLRRIEFPFLLLSLLECLKPQTHQNNLSIVFRKIFLLLSFLHNLMRSLLGDKDQCFSEMSAINSSKHFDKSLTWRFLYGVSAHNEGFFPQSVSEAIDAWDNFFLNLYKMVVSSLFVLHPETGYIPLGWSCLFSIPSNMPLYTSALDFDASILRLMNFTEAEGAPTYSVSRQTRLFGLGVNGCRLLLRSLVQLLGVNAVKQLARDSSMSSYSPTLSHASPFWPHGESIVDFIDVGCPLLSAEQLYCVMNFNDVRTKDLPFFSTVLLNVRNLGRAVNATVSKVPTTTSTTTPLHCGLQLLSFDERKVCRLTELLVAEADLCNGLDFLLCLLDFDLCIEHSSGEDRRHGRHGHLDGVNNFPTSSTGKGCFGGSGSSEEGHIAGIKRTVLLTIADVLGELIWLSHKNRCFQPRLLTNLIDKFADLLPNAVKFDEYLFASWNIQIPAMTIWSHRSAIHIAVRYLESLFANGHVDVWGMRVCYLALAYLLTSEMTLVEYLVEASNVPSPTTICGSGKYHYYDLRMLEAMKMIALCLADIGLYLTTKKCGNEKVEVERQEKLNEVRWQTWLSGVSRNLSFAFPANPLHSDSIISLTHLDLCQGSDPENLIYRLVKCCQASRILDRETCSTPNMEDFLCLHVYRLRSAAEVCYKNAFHIRRCMDSKSLPDLEYKIHPLIPLLSFPPTIVRNPLVHHSA